MNNPLGVSPSMVKGIREPREVKKKSFDLGGNRTHDLRIRSTVTDLILCFTICVHSATRHNIHMYPYGKKVWFRVIPNDW